MDTETLIRITKQKRLESMSDAEKQIHDRLGQLSSKLSWVVEYPPKSGEQASKQAPPQTELTVNTSSKESALKANNLAILQMMQEMDDEEDEFDEDEDDNGEFNEEDLDEEDRAALQKLREEQLKKLGSLGQLQDIIGGQGEYMVGEEHYEEGEEYPQGGRAYREYQEMRSEDVSVHSDQFQRSSPTMESFQMIGPSVAKCLVCNKIVRKSETKQHLESHVAQMEQAEAEEEMDEENEEEEDYEEEGYEEEETLHSEEYSEEPEFTAEKVVEEPFIAEKIIENEENSKTSEKSTVCDICNKTFKTHGNMMRHKNIHTVSKDFVCPVCSKAFKLQVYLTKHLKKSHKDYKDSQEKLTQEKDTAQTEDEQSTDANT